jgi:hypothetical protein
VRAAPRRAPTHRRGRPAAPRPPAATLAARHGCVVALAPRHPPRTDLLNAPKIFAQAWKIIRRALDEWTRERIDFVTDDEIYAGYFLARFDASELYTNLGGTRDPAELESDVVPGFAAQPGTDLDPELTFNWREKPMPPRIQRLIAQAKEQAKQAKRDKASQKA